MGCPREACFVANTLHDIGQDMFQYLRNEGVVAGNAKVPGVPEAFANPPCFLLPALRPDPPGCPSFSLYIPLRLKSICGPSGGLASLLESSRS